MAAGSTVADTVSAPGQRASRQLVNLDQDTADLTEREFDETRHHPPGTMSHRDAGAK
jgi:hypothetical protein